eukprot:2052395-Prymnesium_polylepis.2
MGGGLRGGAERRARGIHSRGRHGAAEKRLAKGSVCVLQRTGRRVGFCKLNTGNTAPPTCTLRAHIAPLGPRDHCGTVSQM